MKDEECLRATAELDVWRETQRKTAEEETQKTSTNNTTHDNQKTERVNVTPAEKPLHNAANTTTGKQTTGSKQPQNDSSYNMLYKKTSMTK